MFGFTCMPLCKFLLPPFAQWTVGARPAPGLPCALFQLRVRRQGITRAKCAARMRSCVCDDTLAVIARFNRAIQYSETVMAQSIGRGVLDSPPSRGMTVAFGKRFSCHTPSLRAQRSNPESFRGCIPGLLRCARNDGVEAGVRKLPLACPGRSAASPRRCEASSGATMRYRAGAQASATPQRAGSRLCAASLALRVASGT
ncbi:hypothetical protein AB7M16_001223 [Bradyrhizobium sp. USDA 372]